MEPKDSNVSVLHAVTGSRPEDEIMRGVSISIRCRDIHGQCCDSCHDEADDGGLPLIGLTNSSNQVEARVCCLKQVEARKRLSQPPVYRSARLSLPSGKCYR